MTSNAVTPAEPIVITAEVVLSIWRWGEFHRTVAGYVGKDTLIEYEEGPGFGGRKFTLTAEVDILIAISQIACSVIEWRPRHVGRYTLPRSQLPSQDLKRKKRTIS